MTVSDEIERLAALHAAGDMSTDEFARAKAIVLAGASAGATRPARNLSRKAIVIALIAILVGGTAIGLGAIAMAGDNDGGSDSFTQGNEVAAQFRGQLAATEGTPISAVACPNEGLAVGDSVECNVDFSDGTAKTFIVTVGMSDGRLELDAELVD